MENAETIFALATARGRAGVAVIRVSGPLAFSSVIHFTGSLPAIRKTSLRTLKNGDDALDQALVIAFEKGASFTGEDVVEYHLHGGIAVVQSVLDVLSKMDRFRTAAAGEFTRRALENDQLDLPQVEGLADLIEAETEAQRKQAFKVMRGELSFKCASWREKLIRATALLEAVIDFVDEDVPTDVRPEVSQLLAQVLDDLQLEIDGRKAAECIRDGFEVAIVGRPNVGKSTLLNAIAGRDVAITSEIAGTTRDVIEVRLNLEGLPVTLLDLAGIRDSEDKIELLGIDRAKERAAAADIRVFLIEDESDLESIGVSIEEDDITVFGKADILRNDKLSVSGKTGLGIDNLLEKLGNTIASRVVGSSSLIRQRHIEAIEIAVKNIRFAQRTLVESEVLLELVAAELRFAISALDELIGRIDVEQVLGEIFAGFCIGK